MQLPGNGPRSVERNSVNLSLSDLNVAMRRRRCDACNHRGKTLTPVIVYEGLLGEARHRFILCHRCDDMMAPELMQLAG